MGLSGGRATVVVWRAVALAAVVGSTLVASQPVAASADGTHRGLLAYANEQHDELAIMNADGTGRRRLTNAAAMSRAPALSPDGRTVAFARKAGGRWSIFTMKLAGGKPTDVSTAAGLHSAFASYPDWSPDGTKLAFSATGPDGGQDVYVEELASHKLTDLTPGGGDDVVPRWSPDGARIAFGSAGADANFDIHVMDADGGKRIQLTTDPEWQIDPAWSPDGTKIAFTSYSSNGATDILVMGADGSNPRLLTNTPAVDEKQPAWSTRGIAFRSNRSGSPGIYVVRPDGTGLKALSPKLTAEYDPSWTRDGSRILLMTTAYTRTPIAVSRPGGAPRMLTSGPWSDMDPAWSPDGKRIAFARGRIGGSRGAIFTMAGNGGGLRRLTSGASNDSSPAWSPDGARIAFVRAVGAAYHVWVMDADGAHQRQLTRAGDWNVEPSWSPDGRTIVYSAYRGAAQNLYVIDVGTLAERKLTSGVLTDESPAWSPDGRTIAFVAQGRDTGVTEVWLVSPDGSGRKELTHSASANLNPAWSPDGRTIVYEQDEPWGHDSDLYTVARSGGRETLVSGNDWIESAPSWQPLP